jgi:hypothetical protein
MAPLREVFSSSEACCAAPSLLPSSMCERSYSSTCAGEEREDGKKKKVRTWQQGKTVNGKR